MKINHKFFSLPPYISTHWNHVKGLYMRSGVLIINLTCGESIQIPGLPTEIIDLIFSAHAANLEQEEASIESTKSMPQFPMNAQISKDQLESFLQFGASSADGLTSMMQHSETQRDAPDLPKEILEKIQSIMQIIGPTEMLTISPAEKCCNCPHCQITRAIQGDAPHAHHKLDDSDGEDSEEDVPEADLNFEQWNIAQKGQNLFTVTNKLDNDEQYQVYLGQPVGCTCGHEGCEHILAVLKS